MIKNLLLVLLIPFVVFGDEKKVVGTLLIEVTADKMAEEFKQDAEAAKQRYNANPPKGVKGGAIINIKGEVEAVNGSIVTLKTGVVGVTVAIDLKKVPEMKKGRYILEVDGAVFKTYQRGIILIQAESAKTQAIIGKN